MSNPLPKTKPKRRWLQFSMRTVLLLVTLLCVGVSLWVASRERQRRAVVAIDAMGGAIGYVDNERKSKSGAEAFLRRCLPQPYFDDIEVVALINTRVTDAGLAHLEGLTGLEYLFLANTPITDEGLAHLEGLTGLQVLGLKDTQVTDAGLAYLERLADLRYLDLTNTQVTDAGLVHLEGLTALQSLPLDNTEVTDAGLAKLRKALPNCRIWGP